VNRLNHGRIACIVSMVWSALFICIELTIGAGAYAVAQAVLLVTGAGLLRLHARLIARQKSRLPPPANSNHSHANTGDY
jgi:hypothetical protein